jgi:hypothetical protein
MRRLLLFFLFASGAIASDAGDLVVSTRVVETGYIELTNGLDWHRRQPALALLVEVTNHSVSPVTVEIMTCSWWDSFRIAPEGGFRMGGVTDCYRNFPEAHTLRPGGGLVFRFVVIPETPWHARTLRIGFIPVGVGKPGEKDTIWSNDIKVPPISDRGLPVWSDMREAHIHQHLTMRWS